SRRGSPRSGGRAATPTARRTWAPGCKTSCPTRARGALRRCGSRGSLRQGPFEHPRQVLPRIEILFRELPRQTALARIIVQHNTQRLRRVVDGAEAEQAGRRREKPARTRVLDDGRLAARQIADRTVADPGVLQPETGWLRTTELTERALDVFLIRPRRS